MLGYISDNYLRFKLDNVYYVLKRNKVCVIYTFFSKALDPLSAERSSVQMKRGYYLNLNNKVKNILTWYLIQHELYSMILPHIKM